MQNAALSALGLDAVYLPFPVRPEALRRFLRTLADVGALGLNLTIPHKQKALTLVDEVAPTAQRIGAINTVVFRNSRLIGHNTDGAGFLASLRGVLTPKGKRVVMLGAGGAGRAVAVALADAGVASLTLLARNPEQRRGLAAHLRRQGYSGAAHAALDAPDARKRLDEAHLVINTTPLGLKPTDPLPLPEDWIPENRCVADLVYGRGPTRLLQAAARRGCRTVPGWHMLLHQGAEALRLWTGRRPPVEVMRRALLRAGV